MLGEILILSVGNVPQRTLLAPRSLKRDAQRFGVYIAKQLRFPERVLSSPESDVLNAARKCCKAAGITEDRVRIEDRLAALESGREVLRQVCETSGSCLLCTELAFGTRLARTVSDEPLSGSTLLRLGGSAAGDAKSRALLDVVSARDLPDEFPYPDLGGSGRRPRPAYYYRQSAVIPYRMVAGQPEVLVIHSSSGKKWGIPKGIHDPGRTAEDSAANEAREEAGVLGEVRPGQLGVYRYRKWSGICRVEVFALRVTHELSETEWEESHRARQWCRPEEAAAVVHNQDVGHLIRVLPGWLRDRP